MLTTVLFEYEKGKAKAMDKMRKHKLLRFMGEGGTVAASRKLLIVC